MSLEKLPKKTRVILFWCVLFLTFILLLSLWWILGTKGPAASAVDSLRSNFGLFKK